MGQVRERQDAIFMARALELAEAAITGQTPFGAVVVDRDGQLVGEGHNTVRADRDPTAHGEIVAMRDAWRRVGRVGAARRHHALHELRAVSPVLVRDHADRPRPRRVRGARDRRAGLPAAARCGSDGQWPRGSNGRPDWAPLEVVGDFMRDRALEIFAAFPGTRARSRASVDRPR